MRALHGAGWLAHHQRDSTEARAHLVECLSITRELGDAWAEAWALHALGRVAYFEHEPALARSLGEQSLAIAKRIGDDWLIAWGLHH